MGLIGYWIYCGSKLAILVQQAIKELYLQASENKENIILFITENIPFSMRSVSHTLAGHHLSPFHLIQNDYETHSCMRIYFRLSLYEVLKLGCPTSNRVRYQGLKFEVMWCQMNDNYNAEMLRNKNLVPIHRTFILVGRQCCAN